MLLPRNICLKLVLKKNNKKIYIKDCTNEKIYGRVYLNINKMQIALYANTKVRKNVKYTQLLTCYPSNCIRRIVSVFDIPVQNTERDNLNSKGSVSLIFVM